MELESVRVLTSSILMTILTHKSLRPNNKYRGVARNLSEVRTPAKCFSGRGQR